MTRLLSAVAVLLVVIATPPIHAGQTSVAREPGILVPPAGDVPIPSVKVAAEKLTALDRDQGQCARRDRRPAAQRSRSSARCALRPDRRHAVTLTSPASSRSPRSIPGATSWRIMGRDESILAASQVLNVDAGQAVSPSSSCRSEFRRLWGRLGAVARRDAGAGVLRAAASGVRPRAPRHGSHCSPSVARDERAEFSTQPRTAAASGWVDDARARQAARDPMYTAANDVHILDRLAVVYRYRRIAVTVFVLTTAAMMIQGYSNVQMYQAQAQILIEDERSTAVPGISTTDNTYYEDPEPYYKTQYRILKGRDLTRRVVKKLNLENVPEFNGTAEPPPTPVHDAAATRSSGSIELVTPRRPRRAEPPKIDETPDESALVSAFIGRVDVDAGRRQPARRRHVHRARSEVRGRSRSTRWSTSTSSRTSQSSSRARRTCSTGSSKEVAQAAEEGRRTASAALADYRDKQNAMSLDDKQNIVLSRLNKLNDDVMTARTTRRRRRRRSTTRSRRSPPARRPTRIPAIAQNPHGADRQEPARRAAARARRSCSERYGEKHPELRQGQRADLPGSAAAARPRSRPARVQSIKNDYETRRARRADAVAEPRSGARPTRRT